MIFEFEKAYAVMAIAVGEFCYVGGLSLFETIP